MFKFINKLVEKVLKFNNSVSSYKSHSGEIVIPSRAYVNWGVYLANAGEVEQAIEKFESATYMRPQSPESYNNWGIALANIGRYEEAIEKFSAAVKIDPDSVKSYALWGAALVELGRFEESEKMYEKAVELNPKNSEIYVNWGIALARQDKKPLAETKFKKAVSLSPKAHQAIFLWGVILFEIEKYDEAIDKFKLSTNLNFNNPDAWYYWSAALLKQNEFMDAYDKGKIALDMVSSKVEYQINLAEILTEMKKYDKAYEYYNLAEKINPEHPQLYLCWGITLQKQGEHFEAVGKLDKSLQLKPNQTHAMYYLALSLAEIGELDRAETMLENVIANDERYLEAHMKLGAIADIKGNLALAIERYKEASKYNLKKTEANYLIASCYNRLSDYHSAIEYYKKAVEENPEHLDAYVGYAVALNETGDIKEAVRKIRRAYQMAPDSAQINMIYGVILSRDEKLLKDAIEKFNNAIKINSDTFPAYIGKGEALIRLKNYEEAMGVLNEVMFKSPNLVPAMFLIGGTYVEMADQITDHDKNDEYLLKAKEYFEKVLQIDPNHIDSLANMAYIRGKNGDKEAFEREFQRLAYEYPDQKELLNIYLQKSLDKL